jgi:hypothetical protein
MSNGKIHSIPIGSLVRDVDQGDIGIIVGPLVTQPLFGMGYCNTQLVLWPNNLGETAEMDLSAIEQGWVEVLSEAR